MTFRFLVVSSLIFLTACAGIDRRIDAAAEAEGQLEATRTLPDLPAYCREHTRSGVSRGDRLDTALLKTDAALAAEHERTRICAQWYDDLQEGFASDEIPEGPQ